MRAVYTERISELSSNLAVMCELAETALAQATSALLQADADVARTVLDLSPEFDRLEADCEERAFALLALQAPVAGDLRQIVSAIQLVTDLRRMGALAAHIAKIVLLRHPEKVLPEVVSGHFAEMGHIAVALAGAATEVLVSHDAERASGLQDEDDAMDDLHTRLLMVLMNPEWEHSVAAAVGIALLGRFYERYADHAVQVARRVVYLATGALPDQIVDHGLL